MVVYCCHGCCLPSNSFLNGFLDQSQFAAAKLTQYSSKLQRPSDSSRSWIWILLLKDVHPNPGPTTKYPCPVSARNVTGRGVSYLCNHCSGWVHSKCSGLQTKRSTDELRTGYAALAVPHPLWQKHNRYQHQFQHKWLMGINSPSCNSTQMTELGKFLSDITLRWLWYRNQRSPLIRRLQASRTSQQYEKECCQCQGGGLLTLIHKLINLSQKPESPETFLEELTITTTEFIITNV